MQEARAREDAVLLRLATIESSVKRKSEVIKVCPAAVPRESPGIPTVDMPLLPPVDQGLEHTGFHQHSKKQSLKGNADEGVKTKTASSFSAARGSLARKSGESIHRPKKARAPVSTYPTNNTRPTKEFMDSLDGGSGLIAGQPLKCDVVVFPQSLATAQVRICT